MAWPPWRSARRFPINVNTHLPYKLAILLLGSYPREIKNPVQKSLEKLYSEQPQSGNNPNVLSTGNGKGGWEASNMST